MTLNSDAMPSLRGGTSLNSLFGTWKFEVFMLAVVTFMLLVMVVSEVGSVEVLSVVSSIT